jgi:hypothetical protein
MYMPLVNPDANSAFKQKRCVGDEVPSDSWA